MIREDGAGVTVEVIVSPRSSRERIGPVVGDRLKIAVTSPPVEGEANSAVIACLARALGVPRSQVAIVRGDGSRRKTVRIAGVTRAAIEALV